MKYKNGAKLLKSVLVTGLISLSSISLCGQILPPGKGKVRAARKVTNVSRELAVGPAVEKALRHAVVPPSPSVGMPTPPTQLAEIFSSKIPFYISDETVSNWLKHSISVIPASWRGGVFQARPLNKLGMNVFSGTVIKTTYKGQEEIYGVISSHTLAAYQGDPSLSRIFTADVYVRGELLSVPAEIVQISASGGLDLALVKFPAGIERDLRPFELSEEDLTVGDELETVGFCKLAACYLSDRPLLSLSTLYLRAGVEMPPQQRRGLCGAAVLDENGKVVGFHTGGIYGERGEPDYVGYATRAKWANTLVEAYHNGGKAKVPFVLNGEKIVDLEINEFVSYIEVMDGDGEVLWERAVHSKFPYREVEQVIRDYRPHYMDLVTSLVNWEDKYITSRTKHKLGFVNYRYDLRTRKLEEVNQKYDW